MRKTGAAVAVILPLLATAACGGDAEGGSASGEVRMLVNLTDNLTKEYWNGLVKPFEDETGIDVKIEGPTGTKL